MASLSYADLVGDSTGPAPRGKHNSLGSRSSAAVFVIEPVRIDSLSGRLPKYVASLKES